jgi:hypothetical protein
MAMAHVAPKDEDAPSFAREAPLSLRRERECGERDCGERDCGERECGERERDERGGKRPTWGGTAPHVET